MEDWILGWLENQNFGKQNALRLKFCIDDEKTSQAKHKNNRRTFNVSANYLKFACMKNCQNFEIFSHFRSFSIFQRFEFFLKFIPLHNVTNNVVLEFQRMYRGSAMPLSKRFSN